MERSTRPERILRLARKRTPQGERIEDDTNGYVYRRRVISAATARQMLPWRHGRFRQRLLDKAREYGGRHVLLTDEAYTSKTCGACGMQNAKLKSEEKWTCAACGVHLHRDGNAARNILLQHVDGAPVG